MQLQQQDGSGGVAPPAPSASPSPSPAAAQKTPASHLPLARGPVPPLASLSGPTYATAQLLVQQVAYQLSDHIFAFSPETFDLDAAARRWAADDEPNAHGYAPRVLPLQTRSGAGTLALGYLFSPDFDAGRRAVPQTVLAPSLSLRHLRPALDQLSLLHGAARTSPFVAHVASADYDARRGLVPDHAPALQIADELGLALVASASAREVQHMALLATLLAAALPTLHVYDGLRTAREALRVVDVLGPAGLADVYAAVAAAVAPLLADPRRDAADKALATLRAFNDELGTSYEPFEYHGHPAATTVLVVFGGGVEAQLAAPVAARLAQRGERVGVVSVRLYRPFLEDAFLRALPESVARVAVVGQVRDETAVDDASARSVLYDDVLAAVALSDRWAPARAPAVVDLKYAASEPLTPARLAALFRRAAATTTTGSSSSPSRAAREDGAEDGVVDDVRVHLLPSATRQYSFWDVDSAASSSSSSPAAVVADVLAREARSHVSVHETHDNLVQGGAVRTDIRSARRPVEAPYAVDQADVAYVGEEKLLRDVAVVDAVRPGGQLLVRLPSFKDAEPQAELERRLPAWARARLQARRVGLFVLDTSFSPALEKEAPLLVELAFLRLARPERSPEQLVQMLSSSAGGGGGDEATVRECVDALQQCLHAVEVPASWGESAADDGAATAAAPAAAPPALRDLQWNSFAPFDKDEGDEPTPLPQTDTWQAAAKGLAFREAYETQARLRPDLAVRTYTVRVRENRRLTPATYDRHIFHIEFDLGDSGLRYHIGEALGVHADNDPAQVADFMAAYGLGAEDLVQVPSREDPAVLETRTVYQALVRHLDILGRPPKRFYEALAAFATDEAERRKLAALGGAAGAAEFQRRTEVDTVTYVDVLAEFASARPPFAELARMVAPLKRREYSIASAQAVSPTTVALMIVVVDWVDSKGRTRVGQATRYLRGLPVGAAVTVSVKPSVMKLPAQATAPLVMAGLGTGLAPFRAFVQYRALQKARGERIGAILLYLGSRHRREEYLYGEEWEAYVDAGVITLLGAAFSRDQPQKVYIQDRMRQTLDAVVQAYLRDEGSFYLCGPTWPVPDVTAVLQEAIAAEAAQSGRKVDARKEIERLKESGRYVLEVY